LSSFERFARLPAFDPLSMFEFEPGRATLFMNGLSDDHIANTTEDFLIKWNQTQTDYPSEASIDELFEQQVGRTPEAVAVEYNGNSWTYRQLNERGNQLAHLLNKSVSYVALCLDRSPELVAGMLAALKAGSAYVPIDPGYPPERLALMLEHVSVVITTKQYSGLFKDSPIQVIYVEDAISATVPSQNLPRASRGDSVAYVIYTSGSTGKPKGVMVRHRGVIRLFRQSNYLDFRDSDVIAQTLNPCFDASVQEIWGALLHGARLVILDKELLLNPTKFKQALRQHRITAWMTSTALFNVMANEIPETLAQLRYLCFGGETADPRSVLKVLRHGAPEHFYNAYGPTETSVVATCLDIKDLAPNAVSIPIGKPISNTTVYILDDCQNSVPIGVTGELYIGGPGVAVGYLGAPKLTEQRFIPDPFSKIPGAKFYRTGDLAKWLPAGLIEFVGRTDSQLKIRGFRIELGEIETALKRHSAVRDAVVEVRSEDQQDKQLVAYVVAERSGITAQAIREFLGKNLPGYMIPQAIIMCGTIPLNANGKVDKEALRRIPVVGASVAPRNQLEEQLVTIWKQVLGLKSIGVTDNFFELGGDSLLAVHAAKRIEEMAERPVTAIELLAAPTIAKLTERLEKGSIGERRTGTGLNGSRLTSLDGQSSKTAWQTNGTSQNDSELPFELALVAIQPQGSRPAFFNVHDGYGSAMYYAILANRLGLDQPFYGFLAEDKEDRDAREVSIEALCRRDA
jgi:amino acid adenylation domain-containing protein